MVKKSLLQNSKTKTFNIKSLILNLEYESTIPKPKKTLNMKPNCNPKPYILQLKSLTPN